MNATSTASAKPSFLDTTLGKKVVMALTGVILFGFLLGHMAGNLQIFGGADKINSYAAFLHHTKGLLWGTRVVLLVSVIFHFNSAVALYARRASARPVGYTKKQHRGASFASRVMMVSGVVVLAFIVFHLLHFTTGTVHNDFRDLDPDHNMRSAFAIPAVAGAYLFAMVCLAMHLAHGLYSLTQSLGMSHPSYSKRVKGAAVVVAVLLTLGFASIPVAIAANLI